MAPERDPWLVLGVSRASSKETVRQAYLRLVRLHHPDRYPPGSREHHVHEEQMKAVTEAYRTILNHFAGMTSSSPSSRPRPSSRVSVRIDPESLKCRAHARWAVIFCRVCNAPLCSRCDTALSGFCASHRSRR